MLTPDGRTVVLLSAHADDLLRTEAAGLARYLASLNTDHDVVTVTDIAAQLSRTRPLRGHRAVLRAADTVELHAALIALAVGADHPLVSRSSRGEPVRTAFVFAGQGGQWPGMGIDLIDVSAYRDEASRCDRAFREAAGYGGRPGPLGYLTHRTDEPADPVTLQAAQFTHAVSLAAVWRDHGVLPDLTVGHSLGELAAGYVAGAVDLDDAAVVVTARAMLTAELSAAGRYGMAMLGVDPDTAADLSAGLVLEIAAVNGPASTVVSGQHEAIQAVVRRAEGAGAFSRELTVAYPGHTAVLQPLCGQLVDILMKTMPHAKFHTSPVEFISSTLGEPIPAGTGFAEHWAANLRNPVRFDLAIEAAQARGVTVFVEMSAHPTLVHPLTDTVGDTARVLGSGMREDPGGAAAYLSANIAAAAVDDPARRWRDFLPTGGPLLRRFPHAPMRARRLWMDQPDTLPDDRPIGFVEHWQPIDPPVRAHSSAVEIVNLGGGGRRDGRLTELLTVMLSRTDPAAGDNTQEVNDAETLILVVPTETSTNLPGAITEFTALAADHARVKPGPQCRRVWLLTAGAECVGSETQRGGPEPVPAALAALHRSVGFDHPDQVFAHLDLPPAPTAADLCVAAAALTSTETEIAIRAGRLHARRLRRCTGEQLGRHERSAPSQITGRVIITGGTGAIGLAYAQYCAAHGATDIILLSRSGADRREAQCIADIRRRSRVDITALRCDITDAETIRAAAAGYHATPADLVIHTASAEARAAQRVCAETVETAFGAKVIGLDNLARYWPLASNGQILVCSSVLSLWGGAGHGLYAAANRMADTVTAGLRNRGASATAIRWGLWSTVGVVTGIERDRIARTGLTLMDPALAISTGFAAAAAAPGTDPVVLAADWTRLDTFFDSQGVSAPFDRPSTTVSGGAPGTTGSARVVVAAELAAVLGVGVDVDLHRRLIDLGLDSLLALDLRNRLSRCVGRRVAPAVLLSGITGSELADLLESPAEAEAPPVARSANVGRDRVHD